MNTFNKKDPMNYGRLHVAAKSAPLFFIMLILQACTGSYVTTYKPLKNIETNGFCYTENNKAVQPLTKSEQQTLADELRVKDETTIDLMLKKAAYEIVSQAESIEECNRVFQQGTAMFNKTIKQIRQNFSDKKSFNPAKDPNIFTVQKDITDFWREDQSARGSLIGLSETDPKKAGFWANRLATAHTIRTDSEATKYLKDLLNKYDWVDQKRFGKPVSAHAWILIQHADDHVDLQKEVLKRMEPYFKNGGVKPANYAYLWDRVAVNTGKKQRYGTQPIWECKNGQLELQPIENRSEVNQLRKALGMVSVESALAEMSQSVCGSS